MPTPRTITVGASGRHYSTFASLVSDIGSGLPSDIRASGADETWTIEVYNDAVGGGAIVEPGASDLDAALTTDATHYVTIRAAAGNGANGAPNDHTTRSASDPLVYDAAYGVLIQWSVTFGAGLNIGDYVSLENLQFLNDANRGAPVSGGGNGTARPNKGCIFVVAHSNGNYSTFDNINAGAGGEIAFENCLFVTASDDRGPRFKAWSGSGGKAVLKNVTVVFLDPSTTGSLLLDNTAVSLSEVHNCASLGAPTCWTVTGGVLASAGHNASSDASAPGGGAQTGLTLAGEFENPVLGSSGDWRIKDVASQDDAGDPATATATDIIGQTREATPTIGCWERLSGGGGSPVTGSGTAVGPAAEVESTGALAIAGSGTAVAPAAAAEAAAALSIDGGTGSDRIACWDFTRSATFADCRVDGPAGAYTCGQPAWRFREDLVFEEVPADTPRIAWDPATGEALGLAIDSAQRINLAAPHANDFSAWARTAAISVDQNAAGKDGTTSAWTVTDDGLGTDSALSKTISVAADTGSRFHSVWIKAGSQGVARLWMLYLGGSAAAYQVTLDLATGTVTDSWPGTETAPPRNLGGGVWECFLAAPNNGTNDQLVCGIAVGIDDAAAGTIVIERAGIGDGDRPPASWHPSTPGNATLRLTLPTPLPAAWSLLIETVAPWESAQYSRPFVASNGVIPPETYATWQTGGDPPEGAYLIHVVDGAANQVQIGPDLVPADGETLVAAVRYASDDFEIRTSAGAGIAVGGGAPAADMTFIDVGINLLGVPDWASLFIRRFAVIGRGVPSAELARMASAGVPPVPVGGAIAAPAAEVDAQGVLTVAGVAALTAAAAELDALGSLSVTAAADLAAAAAELEAAGTVSMAGSVVFIAPAAEVDASGTTGGGVSGSVVAVAPAAEAEGVGGLSVSGIASLDAPPAAVAAIGTLVATGEAVIVAPAAVAIAAGALSVAGMATVVAPAALVDAEGRTVYRGDVALVAPAAVVEALGTLSIDGSAVLTAPAAVVSATGTTEVLVLTVEPFQALYPASRTRAQLLASATEAGYPESRTLARN